jgi:hypothetical protein
MKTIEIPSGSPTISLGDATTMTKNYVVTVTNTGTGAPVIALITATDTLDGTVNGTFTFPTGAHTSFTFKVNNGAIGYYTEGVGANKGALTVNITGNASGTAATVTGAAQTAITSVGASLVWGTGVANFGAVTKRKPSDQSVTSSTVLVNDNDLSFPIAASEEWVATFKIDAGAADLTTGLKYAITVPSGASLDANTLTTYAPVGAGNSTTWGARSITSGSLLSFGGGGMTDWKITIDVWVLNGATPGNITLQFAQFSSSSIALTFRKGSFVQATRVA